MQSTLAYLAVFILVGSFSSLEARKSGRSNSPSAETINGFKGSIHGVRSGDVVILDTKTIQVKNFHYDGSAPDVFFWVGTGDRPSKRGQQIQDELGSSDKLKGYNGKTIELTLPRGISIKDIDYLSVWCRKYATNFGHVTIPKNLNVPEYSD